MMLVGMFVARLTLKKTTSSVVKNENISATMQAVESD